MPCRLRRRARAVTAISLAAGLTCAGTAHAQTLQLLGTWTLNSAKSTLGGPPPKVQTLTFLPAGAEGISAAEETVYADGLRTRVEYTAMADGRDYPLTGSAEILSRVDTISMTRLSALEIVWTYKKGGAIVLSLPGTLSVDGRTLRMTPPGGQIVLVYEKR